MQVSAKMLWTYRFTLYKTVKDGTEVIMKKKLLLLFVALLLVMSFALVSCGGEEEGPTTPDVGDQNNQVVEDPTLQSFTGLTFESITVDYDGTEHILEIVGTLPEGASVSYTSNKATDAGVYNAVAIVSCEGYNTKTLNATLTINKINYDMSSAAWSSVTTFTYDTTAKSVTLTGLPVGVTVKSYSGNQATDVGSYTASATLNYDTKNYNEPTVPTCSWSISKAQITANVELPGASYEYDTQMHSLAIVGNIPAGTTVTYTYNGNSVAGVTEVGEYTVVATISGNNYHTLTLTAKLTIRSTEKLLYAVNHNGTIYFQNDLDNQRLYKVTGQGTVVKVNNDQPEYFFSAGGDLYYYSTSLFSKVIKKINSAGVVSTVCSVDGEYITTDGQYIYFAVNNLLFNTEENGIYRYSLSGDQAEPERMATCKAAYLCVEGDYLYFSNLSDGKKLYRMSLSTGATACIHDEKVEYIIADNGVLYFDSTDGGSAITKYVISSGSIVKMTTDSGKYLVKVGNDIYYVNNDILTSTIFGDGIYKVSVLASGSLPGTKVISESSNGYSSLVGDGEYLYYYKLNDKHLYRYDPATGEEVDLMASFVPPVEEVTFGGDVTIAEYKGEIYYTNPSDALLYGACLYKYNPQTKVHVKVLADNVAGFWFNGDYLYYSTCVATNYALYRMDMTTGVIEKINSDRCENLIFDGDDIYYVKVDLLTKNKIMKINAKDITAEPVVIYSDKNISLNGLYKDGNTFYFIMNPAIGYQKLYKYTVGDKNATDLDSRATFILVDGNTIFFYDGTSNTIKSCALDGSGVQTIVSNVTINDMYFCNGKLYYSSTETTVGAYYYDVSTKSVVKISDKVGDGFVMINGDVWFVQTAVTYVADYPSHSGNGDGKLYSYNGTTASAK